MKVSSGRIRLSASDLSNHLACRHLTTLDLGAARGELAKPAWADPDSKVRAELGLQFEKRYLAHLAKLEAVGDGRKLEVMSLTEIKHDDQRVLKETAAAMERCGRNCSGCVGRWGVVRASRRIAENGSGRREVGMVI